METTPDKILEALAEKSAEREKLVAQAQAEPFPGSLAAAFDPVERRVGKYKVRHVVPFDHQVFKALNSPFYRQAKELGKPAEERTVTDFSDEDEWDFLFQFLTPVRVVAAIIADGPAAFRERAREAIAFDEGMTILMRQILVNMIVQQVMLSYTTIVETKTKPSSTGSTVTFPTPNKTTGSGGGSPTSSD